MTAPPPLEVRLTSTAVRAYCLKLKEAPRASPLPGLCRLATSYIDTWRGRSLLHPRQLLVAWQSGPALILFCKSLLPCAEVPAGCIISIGLPSYQQLGGEGMKLFCFGGNVGVKLAAFRMKGFIHLHPLPPDSPRG